MIALYTQLLFLTKKNELIANNGVVQCTCSNFHKTFIGGILKTPQGSRNKTTENQTNNIERFQSIRSISKQIQTTCSRGIIKNSFP